MLSRIDTQLSKALIEAGIVAEADVAAFVEEATRSKESLYAILLRSKAASEEDLLKVLSRVMKAPVIDLAQLKGDQAVIDKIPLKVVEYYKMVPIKIEKRRLTIAVSQPLDLRVQDDIRAHLGYEIEFALAREQEVIEAIKRFYGFAAGTIGEMMAKEEKKPGPVTAAAEPVVEKIESTEKMAGDATIAKLVNQIILEAFQKRASDIHIEPYRGKVKLRYRIDGVLYNANVKPEMVRFIQPILSRVKIMSNLNIVERRLPQDGRAIVKIEDTQLDLRVSSIPTPYGESLVIRMLPMNRIYNLAQLGLAPRQLQLFEDLVAEPNGVIFITGPTGSGKSTTLYACLSKINTDERKIITIEDPVEYEMEGVTQIQVSGDIGLSFARGLRSILRHDPDVIMVGEVRDLETAEIAIRVALTGHLVFSTLHTNDAASGITRLIDIGVEPYLVASSLRAFVAQRLIRVICPHCKEEDTASLKADLKKQIAKELGLKKSDDIVIYRGKGCNQCNGTGFWGRVAIYEMLVFTEKIRELVMKRASSTDIKRMALAQGMRTLRQDGWQKVLDGVTTPEEVLEAVEHEKEADVVEAAESQARAGLTEARVWSPSPTDEKAGSGDERRKFIRLDRALNVRYRVVKLKEPAKLKPGTAEEFTVTRNVSAGGLVFIARESVPMGAILELKVELPSEEKPVQCLARVVREDEAEPDKVYEIAVCFLDLSGGDRARFERYIERQEAG